MRASPDSTGTGQNPRRQAGLPRRTLSWTAELGFAAGAAVLSLAGAAIVMRLWRADLHTPFDYQGEVNYNLMLVKGLLDHGGYQENPSLGFPFGQDLYDLGLGTDRVNFVLMRLFGLVTSDPVLVTNLFFLLTFPLAAVAAVFVLRRLGVGPAPALVAAVLFSLLPYHFSRNSHLFLAAYYAVPLAAYIVFGVFGEVRLFARRVNSRRGIPAWITWQSVATVLICVVLGSTGVYYAAFTLVLVSGATLLVFARLRDRRQLLVGAALVGLVGATVVVNLAPTLKYQLNHGVNRAVLRTPQETEEFSLKLSELVLPTDGHRIASVAAWKDRYVQTSLLPSERGQAIGLVATVGFVWLWVVALLAIVGRRTERSLLLYASAAVIVSFLVATTGGLSTILAYVITPQLHAWNRISVFIAFFSLVAVAVLLDRLHGFLRERGLGAAFGAVLAVILLAGALDQTTNRAIPAYAAVSREYHQDDEFSAAISARLDGGDSVFQLPYVPFPEAEPPRPMQDYDPLRPYLHQNELRWSYGATKGRSENWAGDLSAKPLSLVVPAVAAVGFAGIYLDGAGYPDGGRVARSELARITGSQPLSDERGRFAFIDLRAYRDRLEQAGAARVAALRAAAIHPLHIEVGPGFYPQEQDGAHSWHWAAANGELRLINPSGGARTAVLEARLAREPDAAPVIVSLPGGKQKRLQAVPGGSPVRLALTLAPGTNTVHFSTAAPAVLSANVSRALYFRLVDIVLVESVLRESSRGSAHR
ncbi:MAG: hypothetical protein H0V11_00990 [Actinobacteria bacterium]|nr:hypothetical protein [Actinomycetota bacterium]